MSEYLEPKVKVRVEGGSLNELSLDLMIHAIGYESRSRYAAETLSAKYERALAIRFGRHEELYFGENLSWAEGQSQTNVVLAETTSDIARVVLDELATVSDHSGEVLRVGLDISSFSRVDLATIYSALATFGCGRTSLSVDFVYSFAEYIPPPNEHGPVVEFGAVGPEFSGIGESGLGLATVIGLGYESDLALSAQQLLDPVETWLAVPRGVEEQFDEDVETSNEVLLDIVDSRNIWSYRIADLFSTFIELEMLVDGLSRTHNVVLVPLGPKPLVVASLLVSSIHDNTVGVWRLSPGGLRVPREQAANGQMVCIRATFDAEA